MTLTYAMFTQVSCSGLRSVEADNPTLGFELL
jgi:hypothetical protein